MEAKYVTEVKRLIEERKKLTAKICKASITAFPVDSFVCFTKVNGWVTATIEWNTGERIGIRSDTGKSYSIGLYWLLQ